MNQSNTFFQFVRKHVTKYIVSIIALSTPVSLYSQYTFESNIPASFLSQEGSSLSISDKYYKEGIKSLQWQWTKKSSLIINDVAALTAANNKYTSRGGVTLWIYNEEPKQAPLVFAFKDAQDKVAYTFDFYLNFKGWRACWIAFQDMYSATGGNPYKQNIQSLHLTTPEGIDTGRLFFDRWTFSTAVNNQATPDAQLPTNNRFTGRNLWHWAQLWNWSQYEYTIPVPVSLTAEQETELTTMTDNVRKSVFGSANNSVINTAVAMFTNAGIQRSSDGRVTGKPLVSPDEQNSALGELNVKNMNDMLHGLALDYYFNGSNDAVKEERFLLAFDYMTDQGLTYNSCMGTNHHYGYNTRELFKAIWLGKEALKKAGRWEEAFKMSEYWSGLPETRQPYDIAVRDEILDSWNTLIIPKLTTALMIDDLRERYRAMQCLARWTNGSLNYSSGTIGGIKKDGTAFHHGGHYPAYATSGFAYLGEYIGYTKQSSFALNTVASDVFKRALQAMRNYTNLTDWGIGVCGRHPFSGAISNKNIKAFARLAQNNKTTDSELAADYMRLINNSSDADYKTFQKEGIEPAKAPVGFFTYNYTCQGIFRGDDWMVSLKGYNRYVWGSEIYYSDNRFGRYQSYGSILILSDGTPVSESSSRFAENGWDWNRLPGTTTMHLPFSLLNSPYTDTYMDRSSETFAGASSLKSQYGIFAQKLRESNRKNFTPDFVARKSAFCFGNRIICLGSGITNTNSTYATETTLFQQQLLSENEVVVFDNELLSSFPVSKDVTSSKKHILKDLSGNVYRINSPAQIIIKKQAQSSYENKTLAVTNGKFATAYINHGISPQNAGYEYMVAVKPTAQQEATIKGDAYAGYTVMQRDNQAHIVKDNETGIWGYVCFDTYNNSNDNYVMSSSKETIIMIAPEQGNRLTVSVCDPNINLGNTDYTNPAPSQPISKSIQLKGKWLLDEVHPSVTLMEDGENTRVILSCVDGIPVEFTLNNSLSSQSLQKEESVRVRVQDNQVVVSSPAATVDVFNSSAQLLYHNRKDTEDMYISLSDGYYYIRVTTDTDSFTQSVVL